MTLKGGTSQACAACKYQRRRCLPDCPLAPFFPPDQPKMFQNAHKLFGVKNILKILKDLDEDKKTEAMRSIIHQANIRDKYPVHGCWGVISQLRYQVWKAEEELQAVLEQLEMYRQHYHQQQQQVSLTDDDDMPSLGDDDTLSQLELGMAPPNNNNNTNVLSLFNHTQNPPPYNAVAAALPIAQLHSYSNNSYSSSPASYMDSKDDMISISNSMWVHHNNSMEFQSQMVSGNQQEVHD